MKKEDFEFESEKYDLENKYVYDCHTCVIAIASDIFDEDSVKYAASILEKYRDYEDDILDLMLDISLREFYCDGDEITDEYVRNNIGRPYITIDYRKDEEHLDWEFEYAGIMEYCESNLDEHIISIEFTDDLELDNYIQFDG